MNRITLSCFSIICLAGCAPDPGDTLDEDAVGEIAQQIQTCTVTCDPPTYDGNPVSCTSSISCTAEGDHVVCDGRYYYCSPLPPILAVELTSARFGACDAEPGSTTVEYQSQASASGGTGSYSFEWSGATRQTSASANPSHAVSYFSEPSQTVSVTVTSGNQSASDSITLFNNCD